MNRLTPLMSSASPEWQLHEGDCLDGLAALEDRSVDHVITDLPYDAWTHSRGGGVIHYDGGPDLATIPFDANYAAIARRRLNETREQTALAL